MCHQPRRSRATLVISTSVPSRLVFTSYFSSDGLTLKSSLILISDMIIIMDMTNYMSTHYLNSPRIGRGVGDRALRPVCEDQLELAQLPRAVIVLRKGSWLARGQRGVGMHLSI